MLLLKHRYLYYVLNDPELSDIDYDKLEKEVEVFEKEHPELKHPKTPTCCLGSSREEDYPQSIRNLFKGRKAKKKSSEDQKRVYKPKTERTTLW